jgi:hypothetical protein
MKRSAYVRRLTEFNDLEGYLSRFMMAWSFDCENRHVDVTCDSGSVADSATLAGKVRAAPRDQSLRLAVLG